MQFMIAASSPSPSETFKDSTWVPEEAFNQSICLSMVDTTRLSFSPQTGAIDIGEDFKVMILLVM
jgi:hypothetical protein